MIHFANILLYVIGWCLLVAAQAQNSIRSSTNGLPPGFAGFRQWLDIHWLDLAHRAFWCGLFYSVIVTKTTATLHAVGLPVTSFIVAGVGGYAANSAIYQILGLLPFPGLRKEVADFAPPPNSQIVPPSTANGPNPTPGATQP